MNNHHLKLLAIFVSSVIGLTACSSGSGGASTATKPNANIQPSTASSLTAPTATQPESKAEAKKEEKQESKPEVKQEEKQESKPDTVATPNKAAETNALQPSPTPEVDKPADTVSAEQPSTEPEKAVENPEKKDAEPPVAAEDERHKIEYKLDPEVKWRQFAKFLPSNETDVVNPLNVQGKISPVQGAAAYDNGTDNFYDGGKVKMLTKHLAETNYDANYFSQAEINPELSQRYHIYSKETGEELASFQFVNQNYSSYLSWRPKESVSLGGDPVADVMVGYVAVPTKDDFNIKTKANATYKGHLIANQQHNTDQFHTADITLNADFNNMTIKGAITNRNDELLSSRVGANGASYRDGSVTLDPDQVDDDPDYKTDLISQEAWNARAEKLKTQDLAINTLKIKQENGVTSFSGMDALIYTAPNGSKVSKGMVQGIFAGENAEEMVGQIEVSSDRASFGATEVKQ